MLFVNRFKNGKTNPSRRRYVAHDFEYILGVSTLTMLGSLFFEKCVMHYNLIKRAELLIMGSEQDLEYEEKVGFSDFPNQSRKFIKIINTAQKAHISKLKGLFEGLNGFVLMKTLIVTIF